MTANMTPETLRALLIRMHDAIWGPYVEPIERQNEEHEWLSVLSAHADAWEANRRRLERLEKFFWAIRSLAFENYDSLTIERSLAKALHALSDRGATDSEP